MELEEAKAIIEKELRNLEIHKGSQAYDLVYDSAIKVSSRLNKFKLIRHIEDFIAVLPNSAFY